MSDKYEGLTNRQLALVLAVEAKTSSGAFANSDTIELAKRFLNFLEGRL